MFQLNLEIGDSSQDIGRKTTATSSSTNHGSSFVASSEGDQLEQRSTAADCDKSASCSGAAHSSGAGALGVGGGGLALNQLTNPKANLDSSCNNCSSSRKRKAVAKSGRSRHSHGEVEELELEGEAEGNQEEDERTGDEHQNVGEDSERQEVPVSTTQDVAVLTG